mmetsp:Transcript_15575/g.24217  ORF Transcript_15575/g.24217 Transcript_15575/m.24217 type:complete len:123 (-) Transcript_15575:249-617(-)|eukprot:CAMPEP_0184311690 /NCGR_PEP_ID=MMETSP1049-20130417/44076_1 /TAXON_ID=77928 /ORGANISM="Proteomonas sulcata, Strain CCMP704" /LENGTH=122 /DNA_ID=CAMNT_0026627273 /DNA_START=29 /DNA_END=397 /DNA_ORIENTATION=-
MSKKFTLADVATHKTKDDCWITVHGKVYDVTKYLSEHPGGEEIILESAGTDATTNFEDIGHSQGARDILTEYEIGELEGYEPPAAKKKSAAAPSGGDGLSLSKIVIPVIVMAVVAFLAQKFM